MYKRRLFFPTIVIFIVLSVFFVMLSFTGVLEPLRAGVGMIFAPVQRVFIGGFSEEFSVDGNDARKLRTLIAQMKLLQEENISLRNQFKKSGSATHTMIPARIIGMPRFIPGVTLPDEIIIDQGSSSGVAMGDPVVSDDVLIGKINKVTASFSSILLITNPKSAVPVRTLTSDATGILRGQGNGLLVLDNVLLSQKLTKNDLLVTIGDKDISGKGYPSGLLVGEVQRIDKDPSALFQKSTVQGVVDITKKTVVFILH